MIGKDRAELSTSSTTRCSLTSLVMREGSKDFALTAEKDETPQCIEIKFSG